MERIGEELVVEMVEVGREKEKEERMGGKCKKMLKIRRYEVREESK